MTTIKNILAAIGLAVVAVGLFGLAQSSGIIGQLDLSNAVSQQQLDQPVTIQYVVATPTAEAVQPPQVVTAVPVISNEVQPVQPAPVVPSAPTPIAADDFAAACAAGQAAGRRVSPNCPPRAGNGMPPVNLARLTYCLTPDAANYRQALTEGFMMWQATGIEFVEVSGGGCMTEVSTVYDASSPYIGWASVGPGWLTINTFHQPTGIGMAHEIGHLLGFGHYEADGIMNDSGRYLPPTVAEIATVRNLWGME